MRLKFFMTEIKNHALDVVYIVLFNLIWDVKNYNQQRVVGPALPIYEILIKRMVDFENDKIKKIKMNQIKMQT